MQKIKVAVIDNGVNEEKLGCKLKCQVCINQSGKIVSDNNNIKDTKFLHGTTCAAIIKKYFPNSEIYSLRILDKRGKGGIEYFEPALKWCLEQDIKIVSLSLGTTHFRDKTVIRQLVNYCANQGMYIIAATSNGKYVSYPAVFSNVLSVATKNNGYDDIKMKTILGLDVLAESEHELVIEGRNVVAQKSNSYAAPFVTAQAGRLLGEGTSCSNIIELKHLLGNCRNEDMEIIYRYFTPDWICRAQVRNVRKRSKVPYYFDVVNENDNQYDTIIVNELSDVENIVCLKKHIVYLGVESFEGEFEDRFFWSPFKRKQFIELCFSSVREIDIPIVLCEWNNAIDEIFLLTALREKFGEQGYNFYTISTEAESVLYDLEYIPNECLLKKDKILKFLSCEIYYKQSDGILLGISNEGDSKRKKMPFSMDIEIEIEKFESTNKILILDENEMLLYENHCKIDDFLIKQMVDTVVSTLTETDNE